MKGLRRSGRCVIQYCHQIGWRPRSVVFCGVGLQCKEVELIHDEWPDLEILGFEPHPSTFNALKSIFPGELVECGLWSEKTDAILSHKGLHQNGASVYRREDNLDDTKYEVQLVRLDDFGHNFAGGDCLLWIDCEGAEYQLLKGANEFIKGCDVKMVNVEMTGRPTGDWSSPFLVHEELTRLGFVRGWIHSNRVKIGQYDAIYVREDIADDTMRIW